MAEARAQGSGFMSNAEPLLTAAEEALRILRRHHVEAVVIGAVALAGHHYVRYTEDLDLGVNADVETLRAVVTSLREAGYSATLREPDGDDPLGGVIDVTGSFGMLQIVSFFDRFPAVIEDAIQTSTLLVREGSSLRLVPIPHLVALKLYAGGLKSKADIVELLNRNPDVDLPAVRELCKKYRLTGLDELLDQLGE